MSLERRERKDSRHHSISGERAAELEGPLRQESERHVPSGMLASRASPLGRGDADGGDETAPWPLVKDWRSQITQGTQIGRYVVVSGLGEGGMGTVYLANDPVLDRRVALKLLHRTTRISESVNLKARLEREAQALARVSHPNTVAVYDVGTSNDGIFIAMEHVAGVTLRTWLTAAPRHWKEIVEVFLQAARGLSAIHSVGLVHRDFKPSNVIVADTGQVKVLDFGLVRTGSHAEVPTRAAPTVEPDQAAPSQTGDSDSGSRSSPLSNPLTEVGWVSGTPGYIAPELFEGALASPWVDQFAFGAALFGALFNTRAFKGRSAATYRQSLRQGLPRVPPGSNVPAWLANIALRCMSLRPEERFPSMEAVIAALENDPARRWKRLGRAALLAVAVAGAVAAGMELNSRDRCERVTDLQASLWSPQQAARIRERLVSSKPGFTPRIDRALASIHTAASGWANQAHLSCKALRQAQPSAIEVQREACLQRQKQALTILVDAVAQVDAAIVASVDDVVEEFLDGLGCQSDEALMRVRPDDVPPSRKELASTLRARLFRVRVLANLKNLNAALTEARAVAALASQEGLKGFQSEAHTIVGNAEAARGDAEAAMSHYQAAFSLGIEAGTDESAFHAGSVLIRHLQQFRERIGEAKQVMVVVEALFERLGRDPHLELELLRTRASIADAEGNLREAIDLERQHLALARKLTGPDSRITGIALDALASRLWKNGEIIESNRVDAEKMDLYYKAYGADDPAVIYIIPTMARGLMAEGRTASAVEILEPALAQATEVLSADDETTAQLMLGLSRALNGTDDARSLELAKNAVRFYEKKTSPGGLADALCEEARALASLDRANEGLPLCERAAALRENLTDTQGDNQRRTLICKALALQNSDAKLAARFWTQALTVTPPALPAERARMAFGLAKALHRIGAPRAEVERRAHEATAAYAPFPDFADQTAEINKWLKTLR